MLVPRLSALAMVALLACAGPPGPEATDASDAACAPLPTALAGARTLARGPADGLVPLFDPAHPPRFDPPLDTAMTVTDTNGRPWDPRTWSPAPGLHCLTVACGGRQRVFDLRWSPPGEARAALAELVAKRKAGALAEARELARALLPTLTPEDAVYAAIEVARTWQDGRHAAEAVAAWREASRSAEAAGLAGDASRALRAATFEALSGGLLTVADDLLALVEARDRALDDRSGQARTKYYRGLSSWYLGDLRAADRALEDSAGASVAAGAPSDAVSALCMRAAVQHELGDHRRAVATLDAARARMDDRTPEAIRAGLDANDGWIRLVAMTTGALPADFGVPEALLTRALDFHTRSGDVRAQTEDRLNLAWLAWRGGEPARARAQLEATRALLAGARPYSRVFADLLEAELLLTAGQARAAAVRFEATERLARELLPAGASDLRWRAGFGRARALLTAGRRAEALRVAEAALGVLEATGERTPLSSGRALFFADRAALAALIVRERLGSPDPTEWARGLVIHDRTLAHTMRALMRQTERSRLPPAARAALDARRSALSAAQAAFDAREPDGELLEGPDRERWLAARAAEVRRISGLFEELQAWSAQHARADEASILDVARLHAALGPGRALVTFVRLGPDAAAHVVQVAGGEISVRPPGTAPLEGLGQREHVYVAGPVPPSLDPPATWRLDDGTPAVSRLSLSEVPYAAVLQRVSAAMPAPPLVVADPAGDLAAARAEGKAFAAALPGSRLLLGADATRASVSGALEGAALFVFSGHGELRPEDPFGAHLRLAGADRLTLGDILIQRPRVGLVVLNGCHAGAGLPLGGDERLGLADAFLAAGARTVLAPTVAVPDAEASRFLQRFAAADGWQRPGPAWRVAVSEMPEMGASFRLVGEP